MVGGPSRPIPNRVATLVAFLCTGWSLGYVLFGASPAGHDWYGTVAKKWFDDSKGGVPIVTLAVPLLVMASVCSFLVVAKPPPKIGGASYTYVYGSNRCLCLLALPCIVGLRMRQSVARMGFDALSFLFVLLPCTVYFAAAIYRHLYSHDGELATDKKVMEIANAGGMAAMIALSWFLIPVARHSVLLTLMGWSPEKAIRMHIWAGRIGIVGVIWHGLGHMYRWFIRNDGVVSMLFPEAACWAYNHDSSCYDLFRNFTGFVAMLLMVAIALTSLSFVRRASYTFFYKVHVVAGPLSLLFAILHWNRMILFLCPGILFYVASTVPVLVRLVRSFLLENGVKLVSATDLSCLNTTTSRFCTSIVFEVDGEAARRYRPGQYVKLSVPSISAISHPFTVNRVMSRSKQGNQMRIIFRATGQFTRSLSKMILNPSGTGTSASASERTVLAPHMVIDGFYGQSNLVEKVLGYDVAVIVAGGVGVTPYLSLLSDLCSLEGTEGTSDDSSLGLGDVNPKQCIELHWICRDSALIDYVKDEYVAPLTSGGSGRGRTSRSIRIVIHFTGRELSNSNGTDAATPDYSGTADVPAPQSQEGQTVQLGSGGLPFSPTRFSAGCTVSMLGNCPFFLASSAISWLGLVSIWFFYSNYTSKNEIISRSYGVLVLVPISLIIGVLSNVVLDKLDSENSLASWNFRRRHSYIGLGGVHKGGSSDDFEDEEFTRANDETGLSLQNMASLSHGGANLSEKSNGNSADSGVTPDLEVPSLVQGGLQGEESGNAEIVLVEKKGGRPSMDSILASLDSASNPGIFVCGPKSLLEDVKSVAKLRYSMRFRQSLDVSSPEIHEETFEL